MSILKLKNGESTLFNNIPVLNIDDFRTTVIDQIKNGNYISSLFVLPSKEKKFTIIAVIAQPSENSLNIISSIIDKSYPSMTPECPQVHLFEREIFENYGIYPEGHPWLKSVRNKILNENVYNDFFQVTGEQIHEVAVGPVHAGIIEPGHFRFQCAGERVLHLEIVLGYQHREIEPSLKGGPDKRTVKLMETIAGDTSIGHTITYCSLYESLSGTEVPLRAEYLRAIALELERLANHTGDLGALAGDIGFLPTASYCGRLRGDFLNITAFLCGNRFGRSFIIPGGVKYDIGEDDIKEIKIKLNKAYAEVKQAVDLLWETSSVMNRFSRTGKLEKQDCLDLGVVGPAARASGFEKDVRTEFPSGLFKNIKIPVAICQEGDVFSRAFVRWSEIENSVNYINSLLENLPSGKISEPVKSLKPDCVAVSLTEGWRGEICHVAVTDSQGKFSAYKIVDPSFHNWTGLAIAMRNQQISDFPLCNKSFNLSYCGFDL